MLKLRPSCYGITILQTVVYYKLNPNDPWIFRYSVRNPKPSHLISVHPSYTHTGRLIIVCCHQAGDIYNLSSRAMICRIFDTLHVALSTHGLYFYLIESFGNYLALLDKVIWYGYYIYGVPSVYDFICRSFPVTVFPRLASWSCHESPRPISCSF